MAADNQKQDNSQYTSIYSLAIPAGIKRDGTQIKMTNTLTVCGVVFRGVILKKWVGTAHYLLATWVYIVA